MLSTSVNQGNRFLTAQNLQNYLSQPSPQRCCTWALLLGSLFWCPLSSPRRPGGCLWGPNTSLSPRWDRWCKRSLCPYRWARRFLDTVRKKQDITDILQAHHCTRLPLSFINNRGNRLPVKPQGTITYHCTCSDLCVALINLVKNYWKNYFIH